GQIQQAWKLRFDVEAQQVEMRRLHHLDVVLKHLRVGRIGQCLRVVRLVDGGFDNDGLAVQIELVLADGEIAHAEGEALRVNRAIAGEKANFQSIEKRMIGGPESGVGNGEGCCYLQRT